MDVLQLAIKFGLYELEWAISQTRDNVGEAESQAVYRKFGTTFARDPFLMAQMVEQEKVKSDLVDPELIADAKQLYEIAINLQTKLNAAVANGWGILGAHVAQSVEVTIESGMLPEDAVKRMDASALTGPVFLAMIVLYYAVREYNLIQTGAIENEAFAKRPN